MCGYASTNSDDLRNHKVIHTEEYQIKKKKKEEAVAKALSEAGIDYKREHQINMQCILNKENKYIRVDFLIVIDAQIIILEVDENQHRDYPISCDSIRPWKIAETLALSGNTLPIAMIRFNPDVFRINDKVESIKKKDRYKKLIEIIKNWKQDSNLVVSYMYYDQESNGDLCITKEPDFRKETLEIIKKVI